MDRPIWWKETKKINTQPDLRYCAVCNASAPPFRCSRCACAAYCCRDHQREHWTTKHKFTCETLKQERLKAAVNKIQQSSPAIVATNLDEPKPTTHSDLPIPSVELYPYNHFCLAWKMIKLDAYTPLGLLNLGNSCYVNAILQAVIATRPLTAHFRSVKHRCPRPHPDTWCPLCYIESLVDTVLSSNTVHGRKRPISPRPFVSSVRQLHKTFTFGEQHDAQELYVSLLEALEHIWVAEKRAKNNDYNFPTTELAQLGGRQRYSSLETTPGNYAFTFYTRTQVECTSCGNISKSFATESSIVLSVPESSHGIGFFSQHYGGATTSLESLLDGMVEVEILDGDNAYRCDNCKDKVKALKSTAFEVCPNALSVVLNRVDWATDRKREMAVKFPLTLDLSPYRVKNAVDQATSLQYSLYAVVAHEGDTVDDGHYSTFVKYGAGGRKKENEENQEEGRWFLCDDDAVTPVEIDAVLQQQTEAYMLFYERLQPREPLNQNKTKNVEKTRENVVMKVVNNGDAMHIDSNNNNGGDNGMSYEFEHVDEGPNRARSLHFKAHLPGVQDDERPEVEYEETNGDRDKVVTVVGVKIRGNYVLRVPLPMFNVCLPAKKEEWKVQDKMLSAVFEIEKCEIE